MKYCVNLKLWQIHDVVIWCTARGFHRFRTTAVSYPRGNFWTVNHLSVVLVLMMWEKLWTSATKSYWIAYMVLLHFEWLILSRMHPKSSIVMNLSRNVHLLRKSVHEFWRKVYYSKESYVQFGCGKAKFRSVKMVFVGFSASWWSWHNFFVINPCGIILLISWNDSLFWFQLADENA